MSVRLDTLAYTNGLRHLPPIQKATFALTMLVIVLLSHPLPQVTIFGWMSWWIVGRARIPLKTYAGFLLLPVSFLLFSMPALLVNWAVVAPSHALLHVPVGPYELYVSEQGIERSLFLAVRSLSALSCLYFLVFTIPLAEMLQLMRQLRFPDVVVDIMLVSYRFTFVMLEAVLQLRTAQLARGGYQGIQGKWRDISMIVAQLFSRMMISYRQLSIGLAARGFQGDLRVVSGYTHVSSKRYKVEAIAGSVILAIFAWVC